MVRLPVLVAGGFGKQLLKSSTESNAQTSVARKAPLSRNRNSTGLLFFIAPSSKL
jgi:hypothetical protein